MAFSLQHSHAFSLGNALSSCPHLLLFLCVQDMQENEADELEQATVAIFVTGKEDPFHPPKDINIVIDGTRVMNEVPSVASSGSHTHST